MLLNVILAGVPHVSYRHRLARLSPPPKLDQELVATELLPTE